MDEDPNPAKLRAVFEKDKAILSQKIDIMAMQLQEAKRREHRLKSSYHKMIDMVDSFQDDKASPSALFIEATRQGIWNTKIDRHRESGGIRNWHSGAAHYQFSFQDPLSLQVDSDDQKRCSNEASSLAGGKGSHRQILTSTGHDSSRSYSRGAYHLKHAYLTKQLESQKSNLHQRLQEASQSHSIGNSTSACMSSTVRRIDIRREIDNCQTINQRIADRIDTMAKEGQAIRHHSRCQSRGSSKGVSKMPSFNDIEVEASDFVKIDTSSKKLRNSHKKRASKNNFFGENATLRSPLGKSSSKTKVSKSKSPNISTSSAQPSYGTGNCHYTCHTSTHIDNAGIKSIADIKPSRQSIADKSMHDNMTDKSTSRISLGSRTKRSTNQLKDRILNYAAVNEAIRGKHGSKYENQKSLFVKPLSKGKQIKLHLDNAASRVHKTDNSLYIQDDKSTHSNASLHRSSRLQSHDQSMVDNDIRHRMQECNKTRLRHNRDRRDDNSVLSTANYEGQNDKRFESIEMTKDLIHRLMKEKTSKPTGSTKGATKLISNIFAAEDKAKHLHLRNKGMHIKTDCNDSNTLNQSKVGYRSCNNSFNHRKLVNTETTFDGLNLHNPDVSNHRSLTTNTNIDPVISQTTKVRDRHPSAQLPLKPIYIYQKNSPSKQHSKAYFEAVSSYAASKQRHPLASEAIRSSSFKSTSSHTPTININFNGKDVDFSSIKIDSSDPGQIEIKIERQKTKHLADCQKENIDAKHYQAMMAPVTRQAKTPVSSYRPLINLRPQTSRCSALRQRQQATMNARDSSREEQTEINLEESKSEYEQVQSQLNREWNRLQLKYLSPDTSK